MDCIFEYKSVPSRGFSGGPGGWSISVYGSGDVIERKYRIRRKEPESESLLANAPELSEAILAIIRRHSARLQAIPDSLNNGSRDGTMQFFTFGDRKISALNIGRTDPAEAQRRNPGYYERFRDNIAHENAVLDIYDEIAAEIKQRGIGVLPAVN